MGGLESGRNWTVLVDARNSEGSSGNRSSAAAVTTLDVPMQGHPPYLPARLPGLDFTTTIHVVWDAPYGNGLPISNYTVEVDGEAVTVAAGASRPQFSKTDLIPGTAHTFRVRASNAKGAGAWSSWQTFASTSVPRGCSPGVPSCSSV